jgi:hypothetical protein
VFRRKNGTLCQVQSNDESHYIPLIDSLQNLLSDEFILNEVIGRRILKMVKKPNCWRAGVKEEELICEIQCFI